MHAETNPINSKRITKTEGGWGEWGGGPAPLSFVCPLSLPFPLSLHHHYSPSDRLLFSFRSDWWWDGREEEGGGGDEDL